MSILTRKPKEVHNPDCWFCYDNFDAPPLRGGAPCNKPGCGNEAECVTAQSETMAGMFSFQRWSYLCREHQEEANALFFTWLFDEESRAR